MRAFRPLRYAVTALVLAGSLTGVAGCSSSSGSAGPSTAAAQQGAGATGAVKRLEVTITGTTVTPTPAQVDLPVDSTLELVVTSDHDDELHAHGFDAEATLNAGVPTTLRLTAKEPGVYEVETHEPPLTLLTVAVR
jgi:heme/copper-type cytochrome/quinol oxidase subunit 2